MLRLSTRPQDLAARLPLPTPIADPDLLAYLRQTHQIANLATAAEHDARILQVCEYFNISVSESELQAAGDAYRQRHRLTSARQTIDWLKHQRITVEDWSEGIRRQLLTQKLLEFLFGESVDNYYLQNRQDYDRVALSQIVVSDIDSAQTLTQILDKSPEAFCALVLDYSILKDSHQTGGFMGVRYRTKLLPEFASAIAEAKPGDIVGPIFTQLGYHILKLEQIFPTQLTSELRAQILQTLLQSWLAEIKPPTKL